jgi:Fe2+ transport system protein B
MIGFGFLLRLGQVVFGLLIVLLVAWLVYRLVFAVLRYVVDDAQGATQSNLSWLKSKLPKIRRKKDQDSS